MRPELAGAFDWPSNRDLRAEIANIVPSYAGIEHLESTGDSVQWGGRHLCSGGRFPTPSGKGAFSVVDVPDTTVPDGMFRVTTRRGKQFNSILWAEQDPLTGAGRDAVYLDADDAKALAVADGARVVLHSDSGEMPGSVRIVSLPRGNVQVHWPEGNVLLPGGAEHREPDAGIPDYQALVTISHA